ncbi:MAG TPA: hydroxyacid dehydrogenase [Firmicutes bacterium]|jgi:D-3-phosphoglycerate dehydrogenase / 2-oxoglutarate reductase|nr:hydroxyacid dehydrogenase [Bacillota bacterium]
MGKVRAIRLNADIFPVNAEEREWIKAAGIDELVELEDTSPEAIIHVSKDADVLLVTVAKIGRDVISNLQKCKVICRYGVGTDKIDLEAATERGIIVVNVPDFCLNEMAEHTMALLLSLARRLPDMNQKMISGEWNTARLSAMENVSRIAGKKLGLIGFGNIAREVAKRAQAFNMKIVDYHRNVNPEIEKSFGVEPVSLEKLLQESDYVVILIPLSPQTRHLISERELKMMKKSAILINMARGLIVDELALARALKEKWIAGAGIDVYGHLDVFKEPQGPVESPFFGLENVILTPHVGAISLEAIHECPEKGIAEVRGILQGIWPKNCVNPDVKPWFESRHIDRNT